MIRSLRDWVEQRTGLGNVIDAMLLEHIPGGAKWRYVWGSALMFVFTLQMVTGVLLMTAYSPGDTTAWSSVYFIQYQMDFGWLIRGLHHFGSQTMVVLMGVHMLQVVIAGAHLKPREVNWWLGLGLLGTVLGLSLTGYLLPWDQKGFYATQVATNIAGKIPLIGPFMQKIVVGGPEYGNQTLTRFFSLHVAILPGIVIALVIAHIWVFRRHGVTHPKNTRGVVGWFWPDQAFRDMVVSMLIFAAMIGLVLWGWGNKVDPPVNADGSPVVRTLYDQAAHAGRAGLGANLDAPADPNVSYPARPEWYFLFLFQLLKYFEGDLFLVGTLVIPGAIGLLLFVLPLLGFGKARKPAQVFSVLVVVALIGGAGYLTAQAWVEDQKESDLAKQPYLFLKETVAAKRYDAEHARGFQAEMEQAEYQARRAIQLAGEGIPAAGPRLLLRNDPKTAGKALFKVNCASCHNYYDADARKPEEQWLNKNPTASDLTDFGTKKWSQGLLVDYDSDQYFGKTHLKGGKMSGFVAKAKKDPKISADLEGIAEWLATSPRKPAPAENDTSAFAVGYRLFEKHCIECHSYNRKPEDEDPTGPDLTGYGDDEWLRGIIMNPASPIRYGKKNRMPAFRDLEAHGAELLKEQMVRERYQAVKATAGDPPEDEKEKKAWDAKKAKAEADYDQSHKTISLTDLDRELIVRFLLRDFRVVFGGDPISGPPKKK